MLHAIVKVLTLAALAWSVPTARAAEWDGSSLGRAKFGEAWNGVKPGRADLIGKVVLIKAWADWCGPCRVSMPGLASYEKKMRGAGLVVLGVAQQSKKRSAMEVVSTSGVEFPILDGGSLPDANARAFPTYILYDRNGRIVEQQTGAHGADAVSETMRAEIEKALAEASTVLAVAAESYHQQSVVDLAKRLNQGDPPDKLLSELERVLKKGTEHEKAEAARLREQILGFARRLMDDADKAEAKEPHRHFDLMKQVAGRFGNHEIASKAAAFVASVNRDRNLQDEIEASRLYEKMHQTQDRRGVYRTIKQKYPDTRFGRLAREEMEPGR